MSGVTATAVLFDGERLTCANCGDCRAILCSQDRRTGGTVVRPLSVDHKPHRPDERARIEESPAALVCAASRVIDGETSSQLYVCRPSNPANAASSRAGGGGGGPGARGSSEAFAAAEDDDVVEIKYAVMFTRSIGDADAHAHLGVIAEPEMKELRLARGRDLFLILASDGLWDTMSSEEAADVASACPSPLAAADALVSKAQWAWSTRPKGRRDDVTCVVVWLRWMDESEARRESRQRERRLREMDDRQRDKLELAASSQAVPAAAAPRSASRAELSPPSRARAVPPPPPPRLRSPASAAALRPSAPGPTPPHPSRASELDSSRAGRGAQPPGSPAHDGSGSDRASQGSWKEDSESQSEPEPAAAPSAALQLRSARRLPRRHVSARAGAAEIDARADPAAPPAEGTGRQQRRRRRLRDVALADAEASGGDGPGSGGTSSPAPEASGAPAPRRKRLGRRR